MADDDTGVEGWTVYRKLILAELERLSRQVTELNVKIDQFRADDISGIRTEIAVLKVKAAGLGAVAGSVLGGAIAVVVHYVTK